MKTRPTAQAIAMFTIVQKVALDSEPYDDVMHSLSSFARVHASHVSAPMTSGAEGRGSTRSDVGVKHRGASVRVERHHDQGLKPGGGRRDAAGKVLRDRRALRGRGRARNRRVERTVASLAHVAEVPRAPLNRGLEIVRPHPRDEIREHARGAADALREPVDVSVRGEGVPGRLGKSGWS